MVKTHFREFGVNREDYGLLNILLEPLEDKVVIDIIGAYIEDTNFTSALLR
ncbi:MAG: hypothetical protein LZ168_08065 [Thaumarchaeota archaeon]|jgi:hypothetical protein|nr:hypothetical protein [Candidatus Geocrenenecus arthurdayi]